MNCEDKYDDDEVLHNYNREQNRVNKNLKIIAIYFLTMMLIFLGIIVGMVTMFDTSNGQTRICKHTYLYDSIYQETLNYDKGDIQAAKNQGLYSSQDLYNSDICDNCDVLNELDSNELIINDDGKVQLENPCNKRTISWITSMIDGAVSTFSGVVYIADVLYAVTCIIRLLAAAGLVAPTAAGATLATYGWSGTVLAAMNWASYLVNSRIDNGVWNWDSDGS